ncbi:FkbM family methyltransferase [Hoeflea sp.]|uniref:FkbM family methyltransferase n=1 Tax=Hoeflea sp. TaxID=1940281 RepID=UPI0037496D7C
MMKIAPSAFERNAQSHDMTPVYRSRLFDSIPSRAEARMLLGELAEEMCPAAAVVPTGPLVIYGAGTFGRMALDFLNDVGIAPAMVIDARADEIRNSDVWAGIDLRAPDQVSAELKAEALIAVSIVTSPVTPILSQLREQGWRQAVPFYDIAESFRSTHPLSNGWFAGPLQAEDLTGIAESLDAWDDDLSRAHHLMFLAWRLARQEWRFEDVTINNSNRFFVPEIVAALTGDELFVDGGAHNGSVSQHFLAATGPASRIVAFEPDSANADQYAAWVQSLPNEDRSRIELRREALDVRSRRRSFHAGLGFMSQFSQTGSTEILTRTLDTAGLAPGFVKLHLEGGELDALKGGLASFEAARPILAVTVYHNADGIWRTANWMRENLTGYRLLMRTHSWCGTGAVIYALPNERKSPAC